MVSPKSIGKYRVSRTIGEGTFSKVKLAFNSNNDEKVAIKVIDKQMVLKNNLKYQVIKPHFDPSFTPSESNYLIINVTNIDQVQSEIRTMKLLNHPNIVRIHEVYYIYLLFLST
jgi:5'-AMP-activated protein kinase catalytic alpha subunit